MAASGELDKQVMEVFLLGDSKNKHNTSKLFIKEGVCKLPLMKTGHLDQAPFGNQVRALSAESRQELLNEDECDFIVAGFVLPIPKKRKITASEEPNKRARHLQTQPAAQIQQKTLSEPAEDGKTFDPLDCIVVGARIGLPGALWFVGSIDGEVKTGPLALESPPNIYWGCWIAKSKAIQKTPEILNRFTLVVPQVTPLPHNTRHPLDPSPLLKLAPESKKFYRAEVQLEEYNHVRLAYNGLVKSLGGRNQRSILRYYLKRAVDESRGLLDPLFWGGEMAKSAMALPNLDHTRKLMDDILERLNETVSSENADIGTSASSQLPRRLAEVMKNVQPDSRLQQMLKAFGQFQAFKDRK